MARRCKKKRDWNHQAENKINSPRYYAAFFDPVCYCAKTEQNRILTFESHKVPVTCHRPEIAFMNVRKFNNRQKSGFSKSFEVGIGEFQAVMTILLHIAF